MARDFRSSRFRGNRSIGEDVNPSAYIVNLADCMLVLACGFLVALISFWQIDLVPTEQLDQEQLQEIEAEEMPEDVTSGNSYYIEAGTVYQDPNTGLYYIVSEVDENGDAVLELDATQPTDDAALQDGASGAAGDAGASASDASEQEIRNARAMGAD